LSVVQGWWYRFTLAVFQWEAVTRFLTMIEKQGVRAVLEFSGDWINVQNTENFLTSLFVVTCIYLFDGVSRVDSWNVAFGEKTSPNSLLLKQMTMFFCIVFPAISIKRSWEKR
jgi:hypothetical protein